MKSILILVLLVLLTGILTSCGPGAQVEVLTGNGTLTPAAQVQLTPYHTRTVTGTALPPNPFTATVFPTPTATPRTHIVVQGEDLFGIALRYGLTLDELITANPEIDPNFLSIDTALVIPASNLPQEAGLPTPTPALVDMGDPACYRSAEGGLWCFIPVWNAAENPLESVSAQVRLADGQGMQLAERSALTPLNLVPAGRMLPLMVYFPPPVPEGFQVNALLQTAYLLTAADLRYAPAGIEDLVIEVQSEGMQAVVSGRVVFSPESVSASLVWVSAVAMDGEGVVVGVRRWEAVSPASIENGIPFSLNVYSLSGKIQQVDVLVEARF